MKENIYRIDADGSHLEQLTHSRSPHEAFFAAPSPSGSQIAYVDDRAYPQIDGGDLFVMGAAGGHQHPVVTTSGLVGNPDWGTAPLLTGSTGDLTPARPRPQEAPGALSAWLAHRWGGVGQVRP